MFPVQLLPLSPLFRSWRATHVHARTPADDTQGYIFFGSAVKILSEVKNRIVWGTDQPETMDAAGAGGVFGNVYDDISHAAKSAGHSQREEHLETAALLDGSDGGAAATTNPRRDVAMSPVFNRSGAVYPSSSFSSAAAPASVLPESSPLHRRNPLRARSRTWREYAQQHQEDHPPAARGRSMAYPLARTMSAGGTVGRSGKDGGGGVAAAGSVVASITGAKGGRPFHKSRMSGAAIAADDDDEQAPLVTTNTTNNSTATTGRASAGETGNSGDNSTPGQRNYGAMEEGEGGGVGGGVEDRVDRPRGASAGGESRGIAAAASAAARAAAAGEGAVQAYMSVRKTARRGF